MNRTDSEMFLDYKTLKIAMLAIFAIFWPIGVVFTSVGYPQNSPAETENWWKKAQNGYFGRFGPQEVIRTDQEMSIDYKTLQKANFEIFAKFWAFLDPKYGVF